MIDFAKIEKSIKSACLKFMPSPPVLGVETSQISVKIIILKQESDSSASLLNYFIIPLSKDEGYESQEFVSKVTNLLKALQLPHNIEVKFVASGSKIDSKRISLPSMPIGDIAQALRWQAKDHFLFNVDESVLDFEVLESHKRVNDPDGIEVIANIANNRFVDERISFAEKVFKENFSPTVLTPVAYCLHNLYMLGKPQPINDPIAIIDIGHSTTTIAIIKNNTIRLVRQVGVSGQDFTESMAGTLASENGEIELSLDQAESLKKEIGIPDESEALLKDGLSARQVSSMIRPVLERLTNDIRRSFEYYSSQFGEGNVVKIILSGGMSRMKNIKHHIFSMLSMPVELLNAPESLKLKLKGDTAENFKEDFSVIAPCIGAALANPKKMNLMPDFYKKQDIKKIKKTSIRLVFILVTLMLLVFYLFDFGHEQALRKVLNAKQPQWQKLQEVQELYSQIAQKNAIMNQTLKRQVPLYYIFKSLSNLMPREMYLRDIVIKEHATSMDMGGIVLETDETAEVTLSKFIRVLEDSEFFHNVMLNSTKDVKVSKKQALEFQISCNLGSAK